MPFCLKYRRRPYSACIKIQQGRQKHLNIASTVERNEAQNESRIFVHSTRDVDDNLRYQTWGIPSLKR